MFKESENGFIAKIKISPNASKNEILSGEEILKIKVTAQPIENKANKCLIEFLAKSLKCAKSNIQILKGENSKEKTILFKNIPITKLEEVFGINK